LELWGKYSLQDFLALWHDLYNHGLCIEDFQKIRNKFKGANNLLPKIFSAELMRIWEAESLGEPRCWKQSSGAMIYVGSVVASKGNCKSTWPTFVKILTSLANHPEQRCVNNTNWIQKHIIWCDLWYELKIENSLTNLRILS